MKADQSLTLSEINQLSITFTQIFRNEAVLKEITIPLHWNGNLQSYDIRISAEALFDIVHTGQANGMHLKLNKI